MNIAGTIVNRSFRRFTTDDLKKTPENRINGFFFFCNHVANLIKTSFAVKMFWKFIKYPIFATSRSSDAVINCE